MTDEKLETTEDKKEMFDKEYVENMMKTRVAQQQESHDKEKQRLKEEADQLKARIATLESASTPNPAGPPGAGGQPPQEGIPPEMLPYIMAEQKKQEEFKQRLDKATKEDKEFEELQKNGNELPGDLIGFTKYLDNAPAVLKHALKNKKDHALLMAAYDNAKRTENVTDVVRVLNDLSDKVERNIQAKAPGESPYTPTKDLSDSGNTDQDFDIDEYVKGVR